MSNRRGGESSASQHRGPSPLLTAADLIAEGHAAAPMTAVSTEGEGHSGEGLELMVSNLDYNISAREWKKILFAEFQQQVQVCDVIYFKLY